MSRNPKNTRVEQPIRLSWDIVPAITTEEIRNSAGSISRIIATDGSGIARVYDTGTPAPNVEDHAAALVQFCRGIGLTGIFHGSPVGKVGSRHLHYVWVIEAGSQGK